MKRVTFITAAAQLFFTCVIGLYFLGQLHGQKNEMTQVKKESKEKMEKLHFMRRNTLTKPLTETTRPKNISEIIGQGEGVKALMIALSGENPQHVLIYGPPGVGKTAAARVVLEEVKKSGNTPFPLDAPFVEIDATTLHYDERCIADPLLGSVHDPIYQGAGAYGNLGYPQVKEGAVSKAHRGVLFIDEIGEMTSMQMNRLLKVLEDGTVMYESAYYSSEDKNIPRHIRDVFENGMPADFRLVGATTRNPSQIPEALRSRCVEVFFNPLDKQDIEKIISSAAEKLQMNTDETVIKYMAEYTKNGRDSVKMTQLLSAKIRFEGKQKPDIWDADWIVKTLRCERKS